MTQLRVGEAAHLYGCARSTVHRAIKAGRISATHLGDGTRVVDLAELIRYWGEPPTPPNTQQYRNVSGDDVHHETLEALRALRDEVAALRGELAEQRRLPAPPSIWDAIRRRLAKWIEPKS